MSGQRFLAFGLILILITACSGPEGSGPKPVSPGIAEAQKDIAAGKLVLREPPIPAPGWYGDYHRLLKEKGIDVEIVSRQGPKALLDDDLTYNQTMTTEIEKKHGAGIVNKLHRQAEEDWKAKTKN